MIRKTVYLSPAIVKWLEKTAERESRSVSNLLNVLLERICGKDKK